MRRSVVKWPSMPQPQVGPALHIALENTAHPDGPHPSHEDGRSNASVVADHDASEGTPAR